MTSQHKLYIPAIAEHANELVLWFPKEEVMWWKHNQKRELPIGKVRETELIQLMQWIEEGEGLANDSLFEASLVNSIESNTAIAAKWHERWLAICRVKGWSPTL